MLKTLGFHPKNEPIRAVPEGTLPTEQSTTLGAQRTSGVEQD
jgi:hypothetical protein